MKEPLYSYSLSFRNRSSGRKAPELIISAPERTLAHAEHLLRTSRIMEMVDFDRYLREPFMNPWLEPELDLDRRKRAFGIGSCAYLVNMDGEAHIHFPYVPEMASRIAMTLHVLLIALQWNGECEAMASNRSQLYAIRTRCELAPNGWGHAMHGDIYQRLRRWLAEMPIEQKVSVEEKIGNAVLEGYVAFGEPGKGKQLRRWWRHDCYGSIHESGRFLIHCPGNACDIAIYPDSDSFGAEFEYCTFSCHNLDTAVQQLCLLAGFATLCEFAREELDMP